MAARANVLECFDQVAGTSRGVPTMNVRIVSNQPDGVVGYAEGSLTLLPRKPAVGETEPVRDAEPVRIGMLSGILAAERVGVATTRTLTFGNSLPLMFSGREEAPFDRSAAEPIDVKISRDIWSRVVVSIRSAKRNVETKFRANCKGGVLAGTGESLTGDGEEASYLISLSVPRS